eukprot:1180150-Prorocentrum_minimum.AAC.5
MFCAPPPAARNTNIRVSVRGFGCQQRIERCPVATRLSALPRTCEPASESHIHESRVWYHPEFTSAYSRLKRVHGSGCKGTPLHGSSTGCVRYVIFRRGVTNDRIGKRFPGRNVNNLHRLTQILEPIQIPVQILERCEIRQYLRIAAGQSKSLRVTPGACFTYAVKINVGYVAAGVVVASLASLLLHFTSSYFWLFVCLFVMFAPCGCSEPPAARHRCPWRAHRSTCLC